MSKTSSRGKERLSLIHWVENKNNGIHLGQKRSSLDKINYFLILKN